MTKRIIQLIIFLSLGIFFIWISVKNLSQDDMAKIKESAVGIFNFKSMFFIAISMISGAIAHYFRALRNILLIDPLGYRVRITTAFYSIMVCYLTNLAIPRLGEVLRCSFLQRYDKVPFQKSFGTVMIDRALDLIIFVLLFVIIILLNKELLSDLVINKEGVTLGARIDETWALIWNLKSLISGLIIGIIIGFFIKKKRKTAEKQSKIIAKFKNIITGLWQGLISIKDLKRPYLFVIYTIAIWIFYYLGTLMCFFAFDFLQGLGPMPAFMVLVVGAIGFMVAQGGLGAYPLIVAGILVLYGVDYAQGLAAGWIGWTAQTIMILVVGFGVLILASFLKIEDRAVSND